MTTMLTATHRERGFSLVELMVAITISLIILASVASIFVNSNRAYNTQDRLSRTQENGRFALYYLLRDIRMAGYFGCISGITTDRINNTLNNPTDFSYNFAIPLEGADEGATVWSPSGIAVPSHLSGTDVLAIRLVDPSTQVGISEAMPNSSAELKVSNTSGFSQNDIILLSDCATADIMQLTGVQTSSSHFQHQTGTGTPGNAVKNLQKAYDDKAKVFKFSTRRYYITNNSNGIPALFMDQNGGAATELVEGIENMQILYGVDTDGDRQPNYYLRADQAGLQTQTDWANVVSVQIGILSRTPSSKDVDIDSNTYSLPGKNVAAANDHNIRKVFQATVLIRNMTIQ